MGGAVAFLAHASNLSANYWSGHQFPTPTIHHPRAGVVLSRVRKSTSTAPDRRACFRILVSSLAENDMRTFRKTGSPPPDPFISVYLATTVTLSAELSTENAFTRVLTVFPKDGLPLISRIASFVLISISIFADFSFWSDATHFWSAIQSGLENRDFAVEGSRLFGNGLSP